MQKRGFPSFVRGERGARQSTRMQQRAPGTHKADQTRRATALAEGVLERGARDAGVHQRPHAERSLSVGKHVRRPRAWTRFKFCE